MEGELSRDEFLDLRRDYSPFLVHLTRTAEDGTPAKEILAKILRERELRAFNPLCLFNSELGFFVNDFTVVCFTETPIDQVGLLVMPVSGRQSQPEPYGLVFDKEFIRSKGGNPVFYAGDELFSTLWDIYRTAESNSFDKQENRFLALVDKCNGVRDFHWEREWRIVGNLSFTLNDVYLGLCPEQDIYYFEKKFADIKFIDPNWRFTKTLRKLLSTKSE